MDINKPLNSISDLTAYLIDVNKELSTAAEELLPKLFADWHLHVAKYLYSYNKDDRTNKDLVATLIERGKRTFTEGPQNLNGNLSALEAGIKSVLIPPHPDAASTLVMLWGFNLGDDLFADKTSFSPEMSGSEREKSPSLRLSIAMILKESDFYKPKETSTGNTITRVLPIAYSKALE